MRQHCFNTLVTITKAGTQKSTRGELLKQRLKETIAGKTPKRAYLTSCLNSGVCELIGV